MDALYFSVTTLTTVGLGVLSPQTTVGKIFKLIYIFAGLSIILGFMDTVSEETLGRRRKESLELRGLVSLSGRHEERQGLTIPLGFEMDPAGEASSTPTESVVLLAAALGSRSELVGADATIVDEVFKPVDSALLIGSFL